MKSRAVARRRESAAVQLARSVHVNLLVLANRSADQMDEICRGFDLTHAQYVALWVLCLTDDPDAGLPVGAVADGLLNRAADATRLIDRLERAGLVERLPNPRDRRGVLVRATAKGKDRFDEATSRLQAFHRDQWANLDRTEVEELDRLLRKALWQK